MYLREYKGKHGLEKIEDMYSPIIFKAILHKEDIWKGWSKQEQNPLNRAIQWLAEQLKRIYKEKVLSCFEILGICVHVIREDYTQEGPPTHANI